MENSLEYKTIAIKYLTPYPTRGIRTIILEQLKERIEQGYNPARPISVVQKGGFNYIADGNHRFEVCLELGIESLPCIVYNSDSDLYGIAVKCNQDEDTYAPMDLFDWLDVISKLKEEGYTQKQIGNKIGWSKDMVHLHYKLIESVSTQVLELAKAYQKGRVEKKSTNVDFDFTEGWFRNSGLYKLTQKYQLQLMENFITDKCKWNKDKVLKEAAKYETWQNYYNTASNKLHNSTHLENILKLIENNNFKTEKGLFDKIEQFNKEAANKLICGDSVQVLLF